MLKLQKSIVLLLCAGLVSAMCLTACGGKKTEKSFTITGTLPESVASEWIYLYSTEGEMPVAIDSARVEKGAFSIQGIAPDTITMVVLHPGTIDQYPAVAWTIFLEPGNMVVDTLSEFATGTPANDGVHDWMESLMTLMMEDGSPTALRSFFAEHWQEHSGDFAGAIMLAQMSPYMEFSLVDSLAADIPEVYRGNPLVSGFFEQLDAMRLMQPGQHFTDLSLVLLDGTPTSLGDKIGKGDYVLVDFWASWCAPCRQAMPVLKSVVKKFPKLSVIGIAVSDKAEDSQRAVKELGITWPVMSDPDATSARTYGISTIPAMILFAPDGTILARDFEVSELEEIITGLKLES